MFTQNQIQNLVGLLDRVQLTGNEVPAFNELVNILKAEYAELTKPVEPAKEAEPKKEDNKK